MRINADLKYTPEEYNLVRDYLNTRGLKAGPYLRAKLLQEAKSWVVIKDGSTQVDMEYLRQMGGQV